MDSKIKVIIVDDHQVFSDGLKSVLPLYGNIDVVATAKTEKELKSLLEKMEIDVLLLDLKLAEGPNGFKILENLNKSIYKIKTIILSMETQASFVNKAKDLGAMGYLRKEASAAEICEAIETIVKTGGFYCSKKHKNENPFDELSTKELETVILIVAGKSNFEIAETLNRSKDTIDTHRKRIYQKLDLHSIVDLVKLAIKHGITDV